HQSFKSVARRIAFGNRLRAQQRLALLDIETGAGAIEVLGRLGKLAAALETAALVIIRPRADPIALGCVLETLVRPRLLVQAFKTKAKVDLVLSTRRFSFGRALEMRQGLVQLSNLEQTEAQAIREWNAFGL